MDFQIYRHKYKVQVNKQQEYYVCTFLLQSNIFTCTSLKKKNAKNDWPKVSMYICGLKFRIGL